MGKPRAFVFKQIFGTKWSFPLVTQFFFYKNKYSYLENRYIFGGASPGGNDCTQLLINIYLTRLENACRWILDHSSMQNISKALSFLGFFLWTARTLQLRAQIFSSRNRRNRRKFCVAAPICLSISVCASGHCLAGRTDHGLVSAFWHRQAGFGLKCSGMPLLWSCDLWAPLCL